MDINKIINKIREKQDLIFGIASFMIFCMILLLNCLTPMAADDYSYVFLFASTEPIRNFADILQSQLAHYFSWGGRSIVHIIAQTFLWWGKPVFNVFNSIVFIIYVCLMSYFAFGRKNIAGLICSFLIVWFTLPSIGSVIFWLVGSCNYLWGTTLVFIFIYRYYNFISSDKENRKDSVCLAILWFFYGIIAGWCNENTSGMGIFVCILFTLYVYIKNKQITKWQISGLLGAIAGYLFMLLAPGNFIRSNAFDTPSNPLKRLLEGFIRANAKAFTAEGVYGIIFFIFLFTYLFMLVLPAVDKERKIIGGIWFFGALACNYAMIMAPYYPDRASFGVYSMYYVSVFYAGSTIIAHFNKQYLLNVVGVLICISCLYFSISYIEAAYDIGLTYHRNRERTEVVISEKNKGNYDIYVNPIDPNTKYNVFFTVGDWPDYGVANYFGVNSINLYD